VRSLLSECGYGITPSDGSDLAPRLFASGACVLLVDLAATGGKMDDVVRLARIAGVPVVALGGSTAGPMPGVEQRLSAPCDDVALVAAIEVSCFGHDHGREDAPAPFFAALSPTGSDR
jgi:hypothetical protein